MKVRIGSLVLDSSKIAAVLLYSDGSGIVFPSKVSFKDNFEDAIGFEDLPTYGLMEDLEGFVKLHGEETVWLINGKKILTLDYDEDEEAVIIFLENFDSQNEENIIVITREEDEELFKRAKMLYEEWVAITS